MLVLKGSRVHFSTCVVHPYYSATVEMDAAKTTDGDTTATTAATDTTADTTATTDTTTDTKPEVKFEDLSQSEKSLQDRVTKLHAILGGDTTIAQHLQFLIRANKADLLILKNTKVSELFPVIFMNYADTYMYMYCTCMYIKCSRIVHVYVHVHALMYSAIILRGN